MRHLLPITGFMLFGLFGCAAAPHRPTALGPPPNLLLGNDPAVTQVALNIAPRATWPAFNTGYRAEDVTTYDIYTLDNQFWFERNNGLSWNVNESRRSGVVVH